MRKIVVITGEKSGEMHAAEVCREIKRHHPTIEIVGWGGTAMKSAGVDIRREISTLAIMGFWEVVKNIFFVKKLFDECKKMISAVQPDLILYVDYSGFNLRMAKWSAAAGFLNYYFIPPKTWAWNQKRTHQLRQNFKKVYTILPFEDAFFKTYNVESVYVGNPSKEAVDKHRSELHEPSPESKHVIALIPGSRGSEIKRCLPTMCQMKLHFPEYEFVISGVNSVDASLYKIAADYQIPVLFDTFYDILKRSNFAIVTSGTATLETALLDVPQVVVFKTSWLTYQIARFFVKVKYISLVNLIAEELVVEELIQHNFEVNKLKKAVFSLKNRQHFVREKYEIVRQRLGNQLPAHEVASSLIEALNLPK